MVFLRLEMGNLRWTSIVFVFVFLVGSTSSVEVSQTEPSVHGSSHRPVTLSSLASFARRFWSTMASMAANDARLRRDNLVLNGSASTVIDEDTSPDDGASTFPSTELLSPDHSVELFAPHATVTTNNNDSVDEKEFPKGVTRQQTSTSRRGRKRVDPKAVDSDFSPKLFTGHHQPSANEFQKVGGIEVFRPVASGTEKNVPRGTTGEFSKTTPCNETGPSSQRTVEMEREASSVPWPPPPPRLVHDELVAVIDDDVVHHGSTVSLASTTADVDFSRFTTGRTPTNFPKTSNTRKEVSTEFVARPRSAQRTAGSKRTSATREFTTRPTVFVESFETTDAPFGSTFAATDSTFDPSVATTVSPQVLTTTSLTDSQVSLLEIFDRNIINNETLLASSMSKLSSLLTSSILSQEESEQQSIEGRSSTTSIAESSSRPSTQANDDFTSDFDFSSLFSSSNDSSPASSVASTFVPSSTLEDTSSLDPFFLDPTVPLSDPPGHRPTTPGNDIIFLVPPKNITSNRTAPLVSVPVEFIDIDDEETSDDDDDVIFELKEAGLKQDKKEHTLKKPNKSAELIRLPVKNFTEEPGDCFFNISDQAKLCDWSTSTQSSVQWSFGLGDTAFMSGGPTVDSNGQTDGGYAFVETSSGLQGPTSEIQRASFESPVLSKTLPHGRCFTFWHNIGGLSADRLRVLLVPEEQFQQNTQLLSRMPSFTVLWERKDTTNSTWMKGEILYTFSKEHRLIFEGFARSGSDPRRKFQGFIAVDDLAMDSDSCQAYCTFEGVLCAWENNDEGDDFDWELARGSDSHLTGPIRDHGDGPEGGFMFIDTAYPRRPGDAARLTSPQLAPTDNGPICFRFWTHMYGNGIGTLRVVLLASGDENVIWEVSGESGNSWHMAQVTVASATEFQLSMEGKVGKNALGRIAIDDVSFGPGPCPSSPQSALPLRGDCTFEADECGWINAGSGDQYDWLRTSAGQPLLPGQGPNSGYRPPEPLSDHTTGLSSGFFLTMERSTIPPRSGDQAYIVGPTLQGTGANKCFSFWGYMHERSVDAAGPGLGSLRVYLRVGASSILRPVWRLINFEHPDWFFAQTPISTEDKFQVVIGGTWGSTRQGAISVDDFTFYDGNCSVIPTEAEVIPGECNFDSNMCEWTSSVNRTKERTSWQLATNIRRPSNLDDHTYRASSGYVFFDIFSQQPHVVRLESPEIVVRNDSVADNEDDESQRCLTFWFAPFGSSRNTFLRILQKDIASNNETQVWEMTTANFQAFRPEWVYGQVALSVNATHKLIFEGSSNNGGFALDDIMFVPGTCHSRPDNL